jgi:hypothetical protein
MRSWITLSQISLTFGYGGASAFQQSHLSYVPKVDLDGMRQFLLVMRRTEWDGELEILKESIMSVRTLFPTNPHLVIYHHAEAIQWILTNFLLHQ